MSPADARMALRALRVGAAPVNHASLLSVGQDSVKDLLLTALRRLGSSQPVEPILVEGNWGSGKSQTLALAKALAREIGLATAAVTFNARTAALSHPNRIYPVLAQSVETGGSVGLRSIVRRLLNDDATRADVMAFAVDEGGVFGSALAQLARANDQGDRLLLGHSAAWSILSGGDLTIWDDRRRKEAAVHRITCLAALLRACGYGGLVVLGDELESLGQLWNSVSRAGAYNAMGALFTIPSTVWVLGAAGNFQRVVSADIDHGMRASYRLHSAGHRFFEQWTGGGFRRLSPPVLGPEDAEHLAMAIAEIYDRAYGGLGARAKRPLADVVQSWSADPARNPRRLARGLVEALDGLRPMDTRPD